MPSGMDDARGAQGRVVCPRCGLVYSVKIFPKRLLSSFGSVVCPRCRSVTLDTKYCMWCGNRLGASVIGVGAHLQKKAQGSLASEDVTSGTEELMRRYQYVFDVLLLGDAAVGKTTLLKRYAEGVFTVEYSPTLGVVRLERVVRLDEVDVTLRLWDVAGGYADSEESRSVIQRSDAVLLMFELTRRNGLSSIDGYLRLIQRMGRRPPLIYMIANKLDLGRSEAPKEEVERRARQVSGYFEISAKTGENVERLFMNLIKDLLRLRLEGLMAQEA